MELLGSRVRNCSCGSSCCRCSRWLLSKPWLLWSFIATVVGGCGCNVKRHLMHLKLCRCSSDLAVVVTGGVYYKREGGLLVGILFGVLYGLLVCEVEVLCLLRVASCFVYSGLSSLFHFCFSLFLF